MGSLVAALATGTGMLVVARFALGVAIGSAAASVPVYIAEIAPSHVRGRLVSLQQFAITLGILLSYVVGYPLSFAEAWRWMLGLGAVPALVLLFGILFVMRFVPETKDRTLEEIDAELKRRAVGRTA